MRPTTVDHRTPPTTTRPQVRDHRTDAHEAAHAPTTGPVVRDHRTPTTAPAGYVWNKDHWERARAPSTGPANRPPSIAYPNPPVVTRPPVQIAVPPPVAGNQQPVQYTSAQENAAVANMPPVIREMFNQMLKDSPQAAMDFLHRMMAQGSLQSAPRELSTAFSPANVNGSLQNMSLTSGTNEADVVRNMGPGVRDMYKQLLQDDPKQARAFLMQEMMASLKLIGETLSNVQKTRSEISMTFARNARG